MAALNDSWLCISFLLLCALARDSESYLPPGGGQNWGPSSDPSSYRGAIGGSPHGAEPTKVE